MNPPVSRNGASYGPVLEEVRERPGRPDPVGIRLMIADDHTIMREGLRQICARAGDIEVVGEAADGNDVLRNLRRTEVDVLLLDMDLHGISGEGLIKRLLAQHPKLRILAFSNREDPLVAQQAIRGGAAGFLAKSCNQTTLLFAIRRLAAGGRFIEAQLAEQLAFRKSDGTAGAGHEQLSGREYQIMCLLASGLSVNEIAARLGINNRTVSTHKARLMQKMEFASNADLVRYVIGHHLID